MCHLAAGFIEGKPFRRLMQNSVFKYPPDDLFQNHGVCSDGFALSESLRRHLNQNPCEFVTMRAMFAGIFSLRYEKTRPNAWFDFALIHSRTQKIRD